MSGWVSLPLFWLVDVRIAFFGMLSRIPMTTVLPDCLRVVRRYERIGRGLGERTEYSCDGVETAGLSA